LAARLTILWLLAAVAVAVEAAVVVRVACSQELLQSRHSPTRWSLALVVLAPYKAFETPQTVVTHRPLASQPQAAVVAETTTGLLVRLAVPVVAVAVKTLALAAQASLAKALTAAATQVAALPVVAAAVKAGSAVTLPSAVTALLVTAVQVQLTHSAPDRTSHTLVVVVAQVLQAALWAQAVRAVVVQAAIPA